MRIRIKAGGIYGANGEVPVGTEIDLKGEPPAGWKGRYDVISGDPKDGSKLVAASAEDITAAIALLDAGNDDHWTSAGLPAVDAVAEIAGKPVTRASIEAAAPDAKRPEAE